MPPSRLELLTLICEEGNNRQNETAVLRYDFEPVKVINFALASWLSKVLTILLSPCRPELPVRERLPGALPGKYVIVRVFNDQLEYTMKLKRLHQKRNSYDPILDQPLRRVFDFLFYGL